MPETKQRHVRVLPIGKQTNVWRLAHLPYRQGRSHTGDKLKSGGSALSILGGLSVDNAVKRLANRTELH